MRVEILYDEITSCKHGFFYEIKTPTSTIFNGLGQPDTKVEIECSDAMLPAWQKTILAIALPEIYVPTVEKTLKEKYPHLYNELIQNSFGKAKHQVWRMFRSEIIKYCESSILTGKVKVKHQDESTVTIVTNGKKVSKPVYKNKAVVSSVALLASCTAHVMLHVNTSQLNVFLVLLVILLSYLEHKDVNQVMQELGL